MSTCVFSHKGRKYNWMAETLWQVIRRSHRAGCGNRRENETGMECGKLFFLYFFPHFFWLFVLRALSCPVAWFLIREVSWALLAVQRERQTAGLETPRGPGGEEKGRGGKSQQLPGSVPEEASDSGHPVLVLLVLHFCSFSTGIKHLFTSFFSFFFF